MFGNLMNNTEIVACLKHGLLDITPFDKSLLRAVHYPLTPKVVFKTQPDFSVRRVHDFDDGDNPYSIDPNEYLIVEIAERIKMSEGIVGKFVPSSNLIESGYGLTAGRVEHPYGQRGEPIRFGLKNLLDQPNQLAKGVRLAYVEFFDLRGLRNMPFELTERELRIFRSRLQKAKDDGVDYGDGLK